MPAIEIVRLDENPHETEHGFRDDTTSRGVDLDGARIVATYADGTTEVLTWKALDPYTNGGATGTGIDMFYGNSWHELTATKTLTSLEIDLQPANSVFDTTFTSDDDPEGGSTIGSKNGFPFHLSPDHDEMDGDISVTYSGIVNRAGSPAEGDTYTTMVIDFSGLPEGGFIGDLQWNSDIDTLKADDDLKPVGVTCFADGTLIATETGMVPVEMLKAGDMVQTRDNGLQPLKLVLRRSVGARELRKNPKLQPVRITAGALGDAVPERDLRVSRQHRVVAKSNIVTRMFGTDSVLVAAVRLIGLPGIYLEDAETELSYYHLILESHQVIFAEGAATESFLVNAETRKQLSPSAWEEFRTLFPQAALPGFCEPTACPVPSQVMQRNLINRHIKNAKPVYRASGPIGLVSGGERSAALGDHAAELLQT